MNDYELKQFFDEHKVKDRDKKILEQIHKWLANNHEAMLDGIYKKFVAFGSTNETRFNNLYDITNSEWNQFKSRHPQLKKGFQVSGSLCRMGLIQSYYDTRDRIFLDFIAITVFGSRWKTFFKHNAKEHIMKYVIEKKLNMKSYFKKYGSVYVVLQETISTVIQGEDAKDAKRITTILQDGTDQNMIDLVNTIYTRVNALLRTLANHYYEAEKEEKAGYIISVSDEAEEGKLSLSNNTLKLSNLISLIENTNSTTLDDMILKTLRVENPLKRGCLTYVLCNKQEDIFTQYAKIYIDYYTKQHGNDWSKMKSQFIPKATTARMRDPNAKNLDNKIMKLIREYVKQYTKTSNVDPEDMKTSNGVVKLTKVVKDYIVIKIRSLMNEL